MASKVRPSTRELGPPRHEGGLPVRRRAASEVEDALSSIPGAPATAVLHAEEQGWIKLEGRRALRSTPGTRDQAPGAIALREHLLDGW